MLRNTWVRHSLDDGDLDEAIAWTRKALAIQDEQIKKRPTRWIISNASA